jgi:hypothetical protein
MANAQLIISQPGRPKRKAEVSSGLVSIGRRADNTLSLEGDSNVSKYHAVIEERGGAHWLTDLGSSNGTLVNHEPLRGERKLADGDLISVGGTSTIEFRLAEADGASAAGGGGPDAGGSGAAGTSASGVALSDLSAVQGAQSGARAAISSASAVLSSASSAPSSLGSFSPTAAASSAASAAIAPANSSLASASSAMSRATSTAGAASSAAAAPAATLSSRLSPPMIIGGVAGVTLIGVVLAILFGTGVVGGGKKAATHKADPASVDQLAAEPESSAASGDAPKKDGAAASASSASGEPSSVAPAAAEPSGASMPVAPMSPTGDASPQELAARASTLATQITQRSGYTFDQNFVLRIKQHVDEYRTAAGYYERARKYQSAVEKEFANNKGIVSLFGYMLAMSRTRFVEKENGVWQLPMPVVQSYAPDMTPADMHDPDKSARVAAIYTKSLLDAFKGRDNFMYAVACYGMPISEVGNVITALQTKDPGGDQRFDFWKMKNAGVVGDQQVDNVARFFAAGIVCEDPQRFGLKQDKPLSSLQ